MRVSLYPCCYSIAVNIHFSLVFQKLVEIHEDSSMWLIIGSSDSHGLFASVPLIPAIRMGEVSLRHRRQLALVELAGLAGLRALPIAGLMPYVVWFQFSDF